MKVNSRSVLGCGCGLALVAAGLLVANSGHGGPTTDSVQDYELLTIATRRVGGGYSQLGSSGVSRRIEWDGETLLRASPDGSTYCCGFTFEVVMELAEKRGLLKGKSYIDMKRFQKQWYGAEPGSNKRQVALAMETLGIGYEVSLDDARPGDFVIYSRTGPKGIGHSVILLDTIRKDGKVIGLYYRSSQPATNGIGNQTEYFSDSGYSNGMIRRDTTVVARLNP
jgi:hypothetical protein